MTTLQPTTRTNRGWLEWFMAILFIGLIALATLTADRDVGTTIVIFTTRFLGIFIEAVPFLLLGTVVSGLIEAFIRAEDIAKLMPRRAVPATIAGAFLGFAFPVCECGVVPVVRRLYTKGLPLSVGIAFLLAAPVMNPIVLASTYIAFGWGPVLIARFVVTAIVAISVGLVFALRATPEEILHPNTIQDVRKEKALADADGITRPTLIQGLKQAFILGGDEFFEMGRFLIIGSALAATMQTFVAQDLLLALGEGPVASVIVMQVLAFVLSVCSTVDAFLALAFAGTFTTGSIIAFLTFGPMVDIKSMLMFLGVFNRKTVAYLILLPLLMTMLIGIWINLNLSI
ncbi:MAG: permease [Chloroflexota bacterium]